MSAKSRFRTRSQMSRADTANLSKNRQEMLRPEFLVVTFDCGEERRNMLVCPYHRAGASATYATRCVLLDPMCLMCWATRGLLTRAATGPSRSNREIGRPVRFARVVRLPARSQKRGKDLSRADYTMRRAERSCAS